MHQDAAVTGISRHPGTAARNTIQPIADVVNLTLKSRAGQTANHIEGRSSANVLQWAISAAGAASFASALLAGIPAVSTAGLSPNAIPLASSSSVLSDSALSDTGSRLTLAARNVSLNATALSTEGMLYRNVPVGGAGSIAHAIESDIDTTGLNAFGATYGVVITSAFTGSATPTGSYGTHSALYIAQVTQVTGGETLNTLYGLRIAAYNAAFVGSYQAINADGTIVAAGSLIGDDVSLNGGAWSVASTGEINGTGPWRTAFNSTLADTLYATAHVAARTNDGSPPAFGFSFSGTSGAALYLNALGDMRIRYSDGTDVGIATTGGSGAISGTTGRLSKFTSSTTLGDSLVSESGSVVTVTGELSITSTLAVTGATSLSEALIFAANGTAGTGRILRTAAGGLVITAIAGSTYDLSIRNAAQDNLIQNPTGTSVTQFPRAGGISVTGVQTNSSRLTFDTNASGSTASIWKSSSTGLTLEGAAGSSYDFSILNPSAQALLRNPTGTQSMEFPGALTASSTLQVVGILSASSRVNIGGATDNSTFALNVAGGSIALSGSNTILSYGSGNPGDANYERMSMVHTGSAAELRSQASGTGTVEPLRLVVGSTTRYEITNAGAHTLTGTVALSSNLTTTAALVLNSSGVANRTIGFQTSGVDRWGITVDNTAESGSNAGSTWRLRAFTDGGSLIDSPIDVVRAAGGAINLNRPVSMSSTLSVTGLQTNASHHTFSTTEAEINKSNNSGRLLLVSGTANNATNGAILRLEGADYGGSGLGGNAALTAPSNTKLFTIAMAVSISGATTLSSTLTVTGTGNHTFNGSTAGTTNHLLVIHTDNTNSSSHGRISIQSGGASGGDAYLAFFITGQATVRNGLDNSDSDALVWSTGSDLGVTNIMRLSLSGNLSLPATAATMAMGTTAATDVAFWISESLTGLAGTSQRGVLSRPVFSSSATTLGAAGEFNLRTAAASFTMASGYGVRIADATKGAGSTITTQYGLRVEDQTQGGTNYAIYTGAGGVRFGGLLTLDAGVQMNSGNAVLNGDDNQATLFSVTQSSNAYIHVGNQNAAERVTLGNTTTNPIVRILGGSGATAGLRLQTNETDATNKEGRIKGAHYTNSEEPITMLFLAAQSASSVLYIGGNSGVENALTGIDFYTAATNTTTNGTRRGGFSSAGVFDVVGNATVGGTLGVTGALTATGGIVFNGGGSNLNYYSTGTFTASWTTGYSGTLDTTFYYVRIGNAVILRMEGDSAMTASSTISTSAGNLPSALRPPVTTSCPCTISSGGTLEAGIIYFLADGQMILARVAGAWPIGTNCGLSNDNGCSYTINS